MFHVNIGVHAPFVKQQIALDAVREATARQFYLRQPQVATNGVPAEAFRGVARRSRSNEGIQDTPARWGPATDKPLREFERIRGFVLVRRFVAHEPAADTNPFDKATWVRECGRFVDIVLTRVAVGAVAAGDAACDLLFSAPRGLAILDRFASPARDASSIRNDVVDFLPVSRSIAHFTTSRELRWVPVCRVISPWDRLGALREHQGVFDIRSQPLPATRAGNAVPMPICWPPTVPAPFPPFVQ